MAREHRDSYAARRTSQPPRKTMKTLLEQKGSKEGLKLRTSWKHGLMDNHTWRKDCFAVATNGSNRLKVRLLESNEHALLFGLLEFTGCISNSFSRFGKSDMAIM